MKEFGGPDTPAIGFALGMERLSALAQEISVEAVPVPKVFIATLGDDAEKRGFIIAETLRARGYWVEQNFGVASLKSQLRKADRINAEFAFIIGENELKAGEFQWKNLRNGKQGIVNISSDASVLADIIEAPHP